jgi:DNA processing protein
MDAYHLMALSQVPGIGPVAGRTLIRYCGTAEAVFKEKKRALFKIPGIGKTVLDSLNHKTNQAKLEQEARFIEDQSISVIPFNSPSYPSRLKQMANSPLILFVKGHADLNHPRITAIVGTRKNTAYGAKITQDLVAGLGPYSSYTLSGLALGIDAFAHRSSIENNIPTIAVVAHGLDMIYPAKHASLADEIVAQGGAIISECFSGTELHPDMFPRRNRIVAGLCDALVVAESMIKGGSMITASIAHSYNRDVFAVPGRKTDKMSEGCNFLIKSLKAAMCESAEDLANGMNWETHNSGNKKQLLLFEKLTPSEQLVAEKLQIKQPMHIDLLLEETKMPLSKLTITLLEMEIKTIIKSMPGNTYALNN